MGLHREAVKVSCIGESVLSESVCITLMKAGDFMDGTGVDRRAFVGLATGGALALGSVLAGCSAQGGAGSAPRADDAAASEDARGAQAGVSMGADGKLVYTYDPLPLAEPDPDSQFGVDKNINIDTIDDFLERPDVAYRDMRMLKDPAHYEEIGGDSSLSVAVEGFRIVPLPYLATVPPLPVSGAYEGDRLFDVDWSGELVAQSVTARYSESIQIIEDVFPKDKALFLTCGGGGYAAATRALLIALGWDASRIYNIGAAWDYTGYHPVELARTNQDGSMSYFSWRAESVAIDFGQLTKVQMRD